MIKEIKKGDVFLLAAFVTAALLIALSPILRSLASSGNDKEAPVLEVRVSGELYGTYDLTKDQDIEIQNEYGSNTLSIRNGAVSMSKSNCRNQICVRTGAIDTQGQMIVCLPHRLSAEIKASSGSVHVVSDDIPSKDSGSKQGNVTGPGGGAAPSYDAISK